MAKLLVIVAALAAVLLVAEASLKVTTIIDESRGSCEQQMREQQNMRNCKQMMMRQARGGGGRYVVNQGMEQDPAFRMCCNEMKQMDSMCICRNLEDMMRMMQREGQMQMEETRMAMGMAENLPRMCDVDSPRRCEFSSRSLVY